MKIVSAHYIADEEASIKAIMDDGQEWIFPNPCTTTEHLLLDEFLAGGGVIGPWDPPMPMGEEQ